LVENDSLGEKTIDALQHIFAKSIKLANDQEAQNLLQKSHDFLDKLRKIELSNQEKDSLDLDKMLENI